MMNDRVREVISTAGRVRMMRWTSLACNALTAIATASHDAYPRRMPGQSSLARQLVLFEIAVYRVSKRQFRVENETRSEASVARLLGELSDPPYPPDEIERTRHLVEKFERRANWEYNEIIGWIRLIHDGPGLVIKAYLFPVTSPRRQGLPRRSYAPGFHPYPFANGNPTHKLFERWLSTSDTNAAVFESLRASLESLTQPGNDLRNRTLDVEAFATIGPYVDWMGAMRRSG